MSCDSQTMLAPDTQIPLLITDDTSLENGFTLSFSDDLGYMIANSWKITRYASIDEQSIPVFETMRFCLESGVFIQADQAVEGGILVSGIPPVPDEASVMYEYFHLSKQVHMGQFDTNGRTIKLSGIGMVDLMDTDPAVFNYHSMPYSGNGVLTLQNGSTISIEALGVMLHKVQIATLSATFVGLAGGSAYDYVNQIDPSSPKSWMVVMGLYYIPLEIIPAEG